VITGDSPHYLIAAQALSHLSLHPIPEYRADLLTHYVFSWPAGATVATMGAHVFVGPHGTIFAQGIGIPALLAPFIAVGSVPLALVAFFCFIAIGFVYLHQRASRLADLGRTGQITFALAMAAPAIWLAATQIYPDLLSGILLACAIVELAIAERVGKLSGQGMWAIGIALSLTPWFQIKNASVDIAAILGIAVLVSLRRIERNRALVVVGLVVASLVLLVVYNQFYFGHVLGLPQSRPDLGLKGVRDTLDLVFDRDHGFLIQCPTILFGIIGLWYSRKFTPVTNIVLVIGIVAILIINGSQPNANALGGVALAGRFQWTVMPMLLAWAPFFLQRLERYRIRMLVIVLTVSSLWAVQGIPVLIGDHAYFNDAILPFAPWDPTLYPGWWRWLNQYLPTAVSPLSVSRLFVEFLFIVGLVFLLDRLARPRPFHIPNILGACALLVVMVGVVVVIGPVDKFPNAPATFTSAVLGGPWDSHNSFTPATAVPFIDAGPGLYQATVAEQLSSTSGSPTRISFISTPIERNLVSNWFSLGHPTSMENMMVSAAPPDVAAGQATTLRIAGSPHSDGVHSVQLRFSLRAASVVSFRVTLGADSDLTISSVELRKIAT
jgi:hypothetical protein